jgi:hypothetical protein
LRPASYRRIEHPPFGALRGENRIDLNLADRGHLDSASEQIDPFEAGRILRNPVAGPGMMGYRGDGKFEAGRILRNPVADEPMERR